MSTKFMADSLRSRQFNRFHLSLFTTLLLNLALTLCSATVSAVEPELSHSGAQSTPAALSPVPPMDSPVLTADSTVALPPVTPEAIAPAPLTPAPVELIQPPVPAAGSAVAPQPQTTSTQARDLLGSSAEQTLTAETLAQTDPTAPADTPTATTPVVNNPLLPPPGWRFEFEPYLFVPFDVQGDIFIGRGRDLVFPNRPQLILGNRGINLGVNARLSDVTAKLTNIFGVSGRVQVWNGNFGIVSDGLYLNAGFRNSSDGDTLTFRDRFNVPVPGFQIETRNTIASFALAGSYRLVTVPFRTITNPADASQYYPAISFEALAGLRYLSVFQGVEFERGPSFEFSGSEFNPMLGGTAKLMLSKQFALFFRGDTSNLGGGRLKQYYNLLAGVDWQFSNSFALRVAYRFNQIEFVQQGRLNGDNGLNLRSQGVQLGVSWQF